MGTNYYMLTKSKLLAHTYFDGEYELKDDPDFHYEIHLGKTSGGWLPIFQSHDKAYKSVGEMLQFFKTHASDISFQDEYGDDMTLDDIYKELIDWNRFPTEHHEAKLNQIIYCRDSLHANDTVTTPFSHVKLAELAGETTSCYHTDSDGFEFLDGDFC